MKEPVVCQDCTIQRTSYNRGDFCVCTGHMHRWVRKAQSATAAPGWGSPPVPTWTAPEPAPGWSPISIPVAATDTGWRLGPPPTPVEPEPVAVLSTDPTVRKGQPIATGVLDYFPRALAEIAHLSKVGNDQHNPGEPLHWAKEKSSDHPDCIVRHLIERGKRDTDGERHTAKMAWRALAELETELENEAKRASP